MRQCLTHHTCPLLPHLSFLSCHPITLSFFDSRLPPPWQACFSVPSLSTALFQHVCDAFPYVAAQNVNEAPLKWLAEPDHATFSKVLETAGNISQQCFGAGCGYEGKPILVVDYLNGSCIVAFNKFSGPESVVSNCMSPLFNIAACGYLASDLNVRVTLSSLPCLACRLLVSLCSPALSVVPMFFHHLSVAKVHASVCKCARIHGHACLCMHACTPLSGHTPPRSCCTASTSNLWPDSCVQQQYRVLFVCIRTGLLRQLYAGF